MTSDSRLMRDANYRGKKAHLVKTYMKHFEAQEKLLQEINYSASKRRIPNSLNKVLNSTSWHESASNWSTLYECNYRLENRSLVLDLDFSMPIIDEEIEILNVVPTNHYNFTTTNEGDDQACWMEYKGPPQIMVNKTISCVTAVDEKRVYQKAIRAQTCSEKYKNYLYDQNNLKNIWEELGCTREAPVVL